MHLDFGNDRRTPADIFAALTRGRSDGRGVVANSTVALVKPIRSKFPALEISARKMLQSFKGIRSVAHVSFSENGDIVLSEV